MYQHKQIIIRRAYYKYLSFKLFFSTTILHLSNNFIINIFFATDYYCEQKRGRR